VGVVTKAVADGGQFSNIGRVARPKLNFGEDQVKGLFALNRGSQLRLVGMDETPKADKRWAWVIVAVCVVATAVVVVAAVVLFLFWIM
jgi:hypothetical protein